MSGNIGHIPNCPICSQTMGSGIKRVVFLPCVFTIHAVHSACLLTALERSQDQYSCPVCRSYPSRDPGGDLQQVMRSLSPLVQDEFLSDTGLTTPASLTLVNAGGSNRNGQQVFVEKWLNAGAMRVWERVVPMPLPHVQQAQPAPSSRSNSQALPNINQEYRPPQEFYVDPNPTLNSGVSGGQAFLDSTNAHLPETNATATLTGSEIDALLESMPVDGPDTEMADGEVGDTIVVQPRE